MGVHVSVHSQYLSLAQTQRDHHRSPSVSFTVLTSDCVTADVDSAHACARCTSALRIILFGAFMCTHTINY